MYLTDDAFNVKVKRFNKMFTSILALFFLLRLANRSYFYVPKRRTFGVDLLISLVLLFTLW